MSKQLSRRRFIRFGVAGVAAAAMYGLGLGGSKIEAQELEPGAHKTTPLIAYFSHTGRTRYMAEQIHARVGGDMVEIQTVKPYLGDDYTVHKIAKEEKRRGFRPELATVIPETARHDVIFIGYPCWWHTMPMAVFSFIEQIDVAGKVVVPFTTHAVSGWGEGLSDLRALAPQADLARGLALYGREVRDASSAHAMGNWLSGLGFHA